MTLGLHYNTRVNPLDETLVNFDFSLPQMPIVFMEY